MAGYPYNLATDGIRDFSRSTLLDKRRISRDPLSGYPTGTVFHSQYYPLLSSGSIVVYVSGSAWVPSSVDYDTGEVVLASAPNVQPQATYTLSPLSTSQFKSILMSAFDDMQSRWTRDNWYLSSGSTTITDPTEDDANIFVVYQDSSGSVFSPLCSGSLAFHQLRTQIRFYMTCAEKVYHELEHAYSARHGIDVRESRGVSIARSRMASNYEGVMDRLDRKVVSAMKSAQDQYYTAGEHIGEFIGPYHSDDYTEDYVWWED